MTTDETARWFLSRGAALGSNRTFAAHRTKVSDHFQKIGSVGDVIVKVS